MQGEWLLNVVPGIVDVAQFQRRKRTEQPSKLPCRIRAELKFVPQAKFLRPATHKQADPQVLDPAAEIDVQHAQRYGHFCLSSPLCPARVVLRVDVQWQQMQADEVNAAGTKAPGNTL